MYIVIFILFIVLLAFILIKGVKNKKPLIQPDNAVEINILTQYVSFYQQLNDVQKNEFLQRIQQFLAKVKITGIKTEVENIDRVLVAAAAIIPIFHFKNWQYHNIEEVLLYPHSFSNNFDLKDGDRNVLGEVGTGGLQQTMIISKPDLINGFMQANSTSNTAIHEFVHLVDKSDGATDGVPEVFLKHQYIVPWVKRIHAEMNLIKDAKSDINPYALTNEAEFFAVVSEYFFKQPHLMKIKHPELYALLELIFENKTDN